MISYYSTIIFMTWMALIILCILVHENGRLVKSEKRLLYITYILIALSAAAEWAGVQMNGREDIPDVLILLTKTWDYILTPLAGGALVSQMNLRNFWQKLLIIILCINTVFQMISLFSGWMVTVDENHCYMHGPLYPAYFGICIIIMVLIVIQFLLYGRSFNRQNQISLYAIMILVVSGVLIQEVLPGEHRTAYLGLTMGAALMFIHYSEFTAQGMDAELARKQTQIDTDVLTGLFSRRAYTRAMQEYGSMDKLPEDLAVFVIDINGLKTVNDTLGHEAGDELICGAADCIKAAFGENGRCYRTGGDEFAVIAEKMNKTYIDFSIKRLAYEAEKWSGEKVKSLGVSIGYALSGENPDADAEGLAREADYKMYAAKAEYYRKAGIERRRT